MFPQNWTNTAYKKHKKCFMKNKNWALNLQYIFYFLFFYILFLLCKNIWLNKKKTSTSLYF